VIRVTRRHLLESTLAAVGLGLIAGCGVVSLPGSLRSAPRRVGYLDVEVGTQKIEPFREGMRALGYIEGQNVIIEYRLSDVNRERLLALVSELLDLHVELIVVANGLAAQAAAQVTSVIPIVTAGGDVVAGGLVTNIARPEGNITGVASNSAEAVGKWLELLRETVPGISQLAGLLDPRAPTASSFLRAAQPAAQALQLQLAWYELRDLDQLTAVLTTARSDGADGLVLVPGGVLGGGGDPRIGAELLKSRLPAVSQQRDFAVNGGLLGHGTDNDALARRAASYVDKILKGALPGELPIELSTEFNIVINLKSAQELGITVPGTVLARATELIQ
jgi:putative ABC transport system substrate-binding protein